MYLWKYWRESRITFGVSLLLVAALFVLLLVSELRHHLIGFDITAGIVTLPVSFLAWRFGSFGVGRDLGEKSGSYLFSRPRTRAFFVWHDWGFAMGQLFLILVALNLTILFEAYRAAKPVHGLAFAGIPVSLTSVVCLHLVTELLLGGLVFGLTYFCTVLARRGGLTLSAGVLLAYVILESVAERYWSIDLPGLVLTEFNQLSRQGISGYANNLGLHIAVRAAVVLLFPIAAQLLLQKSDID